MSERVNKVSDILDKQFKKNDALKLKTLFLVERIYEVEGICLLVLGKFNTGDFRYYAIWDNEDKMDQPKVQDMWEGVFRQKDLIDEDDPVVIQLTNEDYKVKDWFGYFKHMERWIIWARGTD